MHQEDCMYLLVIFRISYFCLHLNLVVFKFGLPVGTVVKNLPANTRDTGDVGWIPGLRS